MNLDTHTSILECLDALEFSKRSPNQQSVDMHKHCILVAASNPYPLQTPVYVPRPQNLEQSETIDSDSGSHLYDAEAVAKAFPQFSISLSVICPKQLPKIKSIYNASQVKGIMKTVPHRGPTVPSEPYWLSHFSGLCRPPSLFWQPTVPDFSDHRRRRISNVLSGRHHHHWTCPVPIYIDSVVTSPDEASRAPTFPFLDVPNNALHRHMWRSFRPLFWRRGRLPWMIIP
ncbi:hypothetical protein JHK82_024786 [Glycine max]|nr:hypothetical protein JHK82_024786 [Glycine max]